MNCRGRGTHLADEPSITDVNRVVDEVLEASLTDAVQRGGVCPLCGHSKHLPFYERDGFLIGSLIAISAVVEVALVLNLFYRSPIRGSHTALDTIISGNPFH